MLDLCATASSRNTDVTCTAHWQQLHFCQMSEKNLLYKVYAGLIFAIRVDQTVINSVLSVLESVYYCKMFKCFLSGRQLTRRTWSVCAWCYWSSGIKPETELHILPIHSPKLCGLYKWTGCPNLKWRPMNNTSSNHRTGDKLSRYRHWYVAVNIHPLPPQIILCGRKSPPPHPTHHPLEADKLLLSQIPSNQWLLSVAMSRFHHLGSLQQS